MLTNDTSSLAGSETRSPNTTGSRPDRRFFWRASAGTVVLAAGLSAAYWVAPDREMAARLAARVAVLDTPDDVSYRLAGYTWSSGANRTYDLRQTSTIATQSTEGMVAVARVIELRAGLTARVASASADEILLEMRLSDVSFGERRGAELVSDPVTNARLCEPVVVRLSPDGAVRAVEFPDGVDPDVRDQLRAVVTTYQAVVPGGSGRSYATTETDGTGQYEAHYEAQDPTWIKKSKTRYLRLHEELARAGSVVIGRSEVDIRLTRRRLWVDSISLEETLRIGPPSGGVIEATISARMESRDGAVRVAVDGAAAGNATSKKERGSPYTELLACVDAVMEDPESLVRGLQLRDLLDARPELADAAVAILDDASDDAVIHRIFRALELSGTPEAQRALAGVMGGTARQTKQRVFAAMALGGVAEPTRETVESAFQIAMDRVGTPPLVQNGALLSVGRMARRLSAAGAADARYAKDLLVSAVGAATKPADVAIALRAIGNTADAGLTPIVRPFLDADATTARLAALAAITVLDAPEAADVLIQRIGLEQERPLQAAVWEGLAALSTVPDHVLARVESELETETEAQARAAIVGVLTRHGQDRPESRAAMARALSRESDVHARTALVRALRETATGSTAANRPTLTRRTMSVRTAR